MQAGRARRRDRRARSVVGLQRAEQGLPQLTNGSWSFYDLARNRSSGEALAIQWEMLCKGAPPPARN
jgi:hypothetical protein